MKAVIGIVIGIGLLSPAASPACPLCTPIIPGGGGSAPTDYVRHKDRNCDYRYSDVGSVFQNMMDLAIAHWRAWAAISMNSEGYEWDIWWEYNSIPSDDAAISEATIVGGDITCVSTAFQDTMLESPWDWNASCPTTPANATSLFKVMLHETGHALGFCWNTHPSSGSVMQQEGCYTALVEETDGACAQFLYQANPISHCSEFTPVLRRGGVSIKWRTEYEYETSHFMLEKKQDDGSFAPIGEAIMSSGSTRAGSNYEYLDRAGTRFDIYRLIEVDKNGIKLGIAEEGVAIKEPPGEAPIVLSDVERIELHRDIAAALEGQAPERTEALTATTSSGIQWLAIYPLAFSDAIAPLITYRHYHGYNASGVSYEHVLSEYGNIKSYLQHLWSSQGNSLKYAVIVGDDEQIPAERCNDGDVGDYYAFYYSDAISVDLAGDWLPELSVGRIPAATADEVSLFVAKVLEYEGQAATDWNNHITFLVDDRDGGFGYQSGPVAARLAGELTELIPASRQLHYKNMLASLPYNQCSQHVQAISEFDAGRGMILAFGSAANRTSLVSWLRTPELYEGCAFSGVQLAQNHKYAFILGASCGIGNMSSGGSPWVLKELLFQRYSGAIGCFAPSSATWQGANHDICSGVLNYLYSWGTPTVGYACYSAQKEEMTDWLPGNAHTARSYLFYGDPAIQLKGSVNGAAPIVTVMNPNGGEYYQTPSTIQIAWQIQDEDLEGVRCAVLINYNSGTGDWSVLASERGANQNGEGSFCYQLPSGTIRYEHCRIKIVAADACGNQGSDMSHADFTIQLATKPGEEPQIPIDPTGRNSVPTKNFLNVPYPNPFNPVTTISFGLKEPIRIALTIYDVNGSVVRTLCNGEYLKAGTYARQWNGTNDRGVTVSSGIYFLQLKTESYSETKRLILIR